MPICSPCAGHPRAEEVLVARADRDLRTWASTPRERVVVAHARPGRSPRPARCATTGVRPSRPRRRSTMASAPQGRSWQEENVASSQLRAGDRPGVEHRAGRVGVVAPVDGVVGAVGIDASRRPGRRRSCGRRIPSGRRGSRPSGSSDGVALVQRAVADLLDVGAVGVHREQVAHDVPVAHAVLRLAGRGEQDPAVGQVDRVDVGQAGAEGELRQAACRRR